MMLPGASPPPLPTVTIRPLHNQVLVDRVDPTTILVHTYSISPDGRTRHFQVPSRDSRWVPTGVSMICPESLLPMVSTPSNLIELKLEVTDFREDPSTGELEIRVMSFRLDAALLPHNTPLATFHFTNLISLSIGDPS